MLRRHTGAALTACALAIGMAALQATPAGHEQGRSVEKRELGMHASQLAALRGATARFHNLSAAIAEGYEPFGGCFSNPAGPGAMGYHYVNNDLVEDPAIDPLRPELLVYAPGPNGQLQLVAVEWITFMAAWHQAGNLDKPSLFHHEFHDNYTLLAEPFYLMHAWIWKDNPSGMFEDYNPRVRCD